MKKATEKEIKDFGVKTPLAETTELHKDETFVLIEASKLSVKDKFMQYSPRTDAENSLMNLLIKAMNQGVKDFYRPKYDPSFDENGDICYVSGKEPALRRSCRWWAIEANNFNCKRKSRLGGVTEYAAFLGVLIKTLVANGWSIEMAWNAVCNDSTKLGHYWSYDNPERTLEMTGSRETVGFCDLSNTLKILEEDKETGRYWIAGGYYFVYAHSRPLSYLHLDEDDVWEPKEHSVGWIILEK